jgi:hypothetical protein
MNRRSISILQTDLNLASNGIISKLSYTFNLAHDVLAYPQ